MKINITEDINKNGLLSHLILHSLSESLASQLAKEGNTNKGVILDVQLKVNGNEINVEEFTKYWQEDVEREIKEAAKDLIKEKICDVTNLLYDLEERLELEINKRLEEWEKE